MVDLPAHVSKRVSDFLAKQPAPVARLTFVLDATGSRERTWDTAMQLQTQMFEAATKLGSLEVQLIYFRGLHECSHSAWTTDARTMVRLMSKVRCETGPTKIGKALAHVRQEHQRQPISAVVYVGDMMEEDHGKLCDAAIGLPKMFVFQEGNDPIAEPTFREIARLTNGAYSRFEPGAEAKLSELLRAVAAFAVGGVAALADQRTDAARLLLEQMKPGGGK